MNLPLHQLLARLLLVFADTSLGDIAVNLITKEF